MLLLEVFVLAADSSFAKKGQMFAEANLFLHFRQYILLYKKRN